ncbi:phosphoethanolamine transferase [Sphaerotilus natans]|uniref:phosphoethanolamine transferase n=1 Tax=Sphaerotilus natans TaxID=34103 RepID=UPI00406C89FE
MNLSAFFALPAPVRLPPSWRRSWSAEGLLLAISVFLLSANSAFFRQALTGRSLGDPSSWGWGLTLAVALLALNFLVLGLMCHGRLLKPVAALLILLAAGGSHFIATFGIYLDPSMLRNALRTDPAEAGELIGLALLASLLFKGVLPAALMWQVPLRRLPFWRAQGRRALWLLGALLLLVAAILVEFRPLSSMMRNQRDLRYLVTPANLVWSTGSVVAADLKGAAKPRQAIGLDATPGPRMSARTRPMRVVLVVGETARAANWGLNGYARQTTPELAAVPGLINFPQVSSCGTNTEVSVPCMFAPVGRRDYDEARIRGSESLLHVLARAGVEVLWRDNQSGCKGVCDGLPSQEMVQINPPGLCADGRCLDEALLAGLDERLARAQGSGLIVLHMLGNHGPSYFRRYPERFARFQPACPSDDLRQCDSTAIANAYDNALLYTDHVLATLIARLKAQAQSDQVDTAMIYLSDHGESLGESNLYLHGLPWAIAPEVQKRVPMVMWFSDGLARQEQIDLDCLRRRAAQPAAHDNLFHTMLGLLDVRTALHEPALDLLAGCRRS